MSVCPKCNTLSYPLQSVWQKKITQPMDLYVQHNNYNSNTLTESTGLSNCKQLSILLITNSYSHKNIKENWKMIWSDIDIERKIKIKIRNWYITFTLRTYTFSNIFYVVILVLCDGVLYWKWIIHKRKCMCHMSAYWYTLLPREKEYGRTKKSLFLVFISRLS